MAWWKNRREISADADAEYAIELELDLATVVPHVSGPNEVKTMVSLAEMERKHVPIQKAYLMSCAESFALGNSPAAVCSKYSISC